MSDIAIVHDYLTQLGGAERVALSLANTFPGAPLHTALYSPEDTFAGFADVDVRPSPLQRLVPARRFRLGGPLYGRTFAAMRLGIHDRLVVSSSGFAHHVHHPEAYVYCHTPPRFIYDLERYFSNRLLVAGSRPFLPWLRRQDQRAAARHRHYAANSRATANRIADIYGKEAPVIHPPLVTDHLPEAIVAPPTEPRALVVARLQPYKRLDLAIDACAKAGVPLTVVGRGPEEAKLRERAAASGGETFFAGAVSDQELADTLVAHSVVLVPGEEDYGMAPVDANYAGRPVLARAAGGALETVQPGTTGTLIPADEADDIGTWAAELDTLLRAKWDPGDLRVTTEPYQLPAFQAAIRRWVDANG